MIRATRTLMFEAGHRLPEHEGKCRRLHGHHYVVDVTVVADEVQPSGSSHGMVRDFADIDAAAAGLIDLLDHRTLLWEHDDLIDAVKAVDPDAVVVVPFVPTAENLARYVYEYLLERGLHDIEEIVVHETPRGRASWKA